MADEKQIAQQDAAAAQAAQVAAAEQAAQRQAAAIVQGVRVEASGVPTPGEQVYAHWGDGTSEPVTVVQHLDGGSVEIQTPDGEVLEVPSNILTTEKPASQAQTPAQGEPHATQAGKQQEGAKATTATQPMKEASQHAAERIKEGLARYIIAILVAAALGYWAYSSWQDHVESDQKRIALDTRHDALKASVMEMASKVNAVTDWAANLASDMKTRESPFLTAELQKHWVIERPILFVGNIADVAINQDGTYQVIVSIWYSALRYRIRVALNCPESVATPLIQAVKAEGTPRWPVADIAIVGHIERIITMDSEEGDTMVRVRTGVGRCLNAIYLDEDIGW